MLFFQRQGEAVNDAGVKERKRDVNPAETVNNYRLHERGFEHTGTETKST